jgi:hypothetical protein
MKVLPWMMVFKNAHCVAKLCIAGQLVSTTTKVSSSASNWSPMHIAAEFPHCTCAISQTIFENFIRGGKHVQFAEEVCHKTINTITLSMCIAKWNTCLMEFTMAPEATLTSNVQSVYTMETALAWVSNALLVKHCPLYPLYADLLVAVSHETREGGSTALVCNQRRPLARKQRSPKRVLIVAKNSKIKHL